MTNSPGYIRTDSEYYPTICECCGLLKHGVAKRRMNTNYTDHESNFIVSCQECFERSEEHWDEMWREYYSGQL